MKTHINGNTIEQLMTNVVTLTQQQYDLLPLEQKNHGTYIISDADSPNINAEDVEYSTGVSVKDKIDNIYSSLASGWSNPIGLATYDFGTIHGRYNSFLKLAFIRIVGKGVVPSAAVFEIPISNENFKPLDLEYGAAIRYGGMMYITYQSTSTVLVLRDLDTTHGWLSGFILYPTQ